PGADASVALGVVELDEILGLAGGDDAVVDGPHAFDVTGVVKIGSRMAGKPVDRALVVAGVQGVDENVAPLAVPDVDRRRHGFDDGAQQGLALTQSRLGLVPAGDVEAYAHDVAHRPRRVEDRRARHEPAALPAARRSVVDFVEVESLAGLDDLAVPSGKLSDIGLRIEVFRAAADEPLGRLAMRLRLESIEENVAAVAIADIDGGRHGIDDRAQESL